MQAFEETGLREEIIRAIKELGFETPTPIQQKTIPHLLSSTKDLVALAQTGTGKTAAFSLPVLHQLDATSKNIQTIILCPTRELCLQISRDIEKFVKYLKGINYTAVYGGDSMERQIRDLRRGPQIVIGTPGRVCDLIRRKKLHLDNVKWVILDEADEMLTMGFKDDLDTILGEMPEERQTLLFSATMPRAVEYIAKKYMTDADYIKASRSNQGADSVEHQYFVVNGQDKYLALKRIADINPDIYGIIFCRTRRDTKEIADLLIKDNYSADALHGDLSQSQREHVMKRFRNKHLQLLVATDVAARGIDVNELTHVINFKLPDQMESYIHRSGRTGRAGNKGISISIIQSKELRDIPMLERKVGKAFIRAQVPTGVDICKTRLFNLIDGVKNVEVQTEQIEQFMPEVYEKLAEVEREDLIRRFVSVEFNRFLEYYKSAPDLNIRDRKKRRERDGKRTKFARFFINVGVKRDVNPARMIGLINDMVGQRNIEIGKIEILKNFSFFEVDKAFEAELIEGAKALQFDGDAVVVEPTKAKSKNFRGAESKGRGGDYKKRGGYGGSNRGGDYRKSGDDRRSGSSPFKKKRKKWNNSK